LAFSNPNRWDEHYQRRHWFTATSCDRLLPHHPLPAPPPSNNNQDDKDDNNNDDGDDGDDDDDDNDYDDDDDDYDDNDDGGLNDINGMSEYKLKRMRNVARNNARLASLGLLGCTPSTATPPSDRPNRKKHMVPQDDVERRVQPKCNPKKTTSYRDLDDHVIIKRT
jgi:hypothetical protein